MAYTQTKGPKLNVPFAHEYDPTTGVQVPVVKVLGSTDGGSGGGAAADREFLTVDYQVKTAFTGADVGDFVRSVEVWDIGATSSTQVGSTTWRNLSKGTTLASAPNINNISVAGASTAGLTNAQLRQSPLPLMDGAATSVLQQAISDAITTMSNKVATQSGLASIFDQIGATNTGIGALNTKLATENTLSSVATLLTAIRDRTPALGTKLVVGSSAVTIATDDTILGPTNETAPANDTAASGLNGRLQRVAQRLTSLIALLPASLGVKVSTAALPVVLASDDAQIGTKVTAIPALATGGTGLIGWLSAQWQALVNLGNQLPATIGRKASTASMSVVLASDDAQIGTPQTASAALSTGGAGILGWLSSIRDSLLGLLTVNTLAQPGTARRIPVAIAGGTAASIALTTTVRRVSMVAVGTSMRYLVGTGTVTALPTSHLIMAGERMDIGVPASGVISAISDTSATGTLEVTELV